MKLPATESKGASPSVSRLNHSIRMPVKRLAKSLASVASKQSQARQKARSAESRRADSKSIDGKRTDIERTDIKRTDSKRADIKRTDGKSVNSKANKSPVPNIPFIKDSKAARVTFTLLLVRPWVLVAGLWLVSLLGSAVAIQGLIKPRLLMQALPEAIVETPPVVTSSIINVVEGEATEGETTGATGAEATGAETTRDGSTEAEAIDAPAEAPNTDGFPLWTLGVLTGTCAAGCLVMSRRRAMARLSAARAKGRVRKKPVRSDVVKPLETAQNLKQMRGSLARSSARGRAANLRPVGVADADIRGMSKGKKRRQRNRRSTGPTPSHTPGIQNTASKNAASKGRKQAQKAASHGHPARSRRVKRASYRSTRQGMVSVVPASESHALDWTNGSLAHQMDVRSHRKAM